MQVGFFGLLGLVFITLKLTGYIDWSWVWVLAPVWFGAALAFIVIVLMAIAAGLTGGRLRITKVKK
jgi:hypothetical protein